ncbi:MAG: nicotinate phosphoribosyltransferase [Brevinema sp.]
MKKNFLMQTNILTSFATDAYKAAHFIQLPPKAEKAHFYIAPRKALREDQQDFVIFGIRYFIERYLLEPITHTDIEECEKIWDHFNIGDTRYPFPKAGFQKIVDHYKGLLPITIVGVKEGQILNQYNTPVFIISVTDPDLVWLPGFIETALQRGIWYPSTVATISYTVKKRLHHAYVKSVDESNYFLINTTLHDFGARGASSGESAALGGLANLLNFRGTDTMEAVLLGHHLYKTPISELACSIIASEHSTVTSWGADHHGERASLEHLINVIKEHNYKIFSFVSDSYNFYNMVDHIWGDPMVIKTILDADITPVVRPDSGDPNEVVLYALESLSKTWGYTLNSKGFKVLNKIRIIQGDGMSIDKIQSLIDTIIDNGYSIENVSFGMGGALLQKLDRDSMSWSMKMYKIKIDGEWRDVRKTPTTQSSKESFNPQNIVDDSEWVTHYKWDENMASPLIFTEEFNKIRERIIFDQ